MRRVILAIGVCIALGASPSLAKQGRHWPGPFEKAEIILEQNVTDGDAEVVFEFKAFEGLRSMIIRDPSGRRIVNLHSRDRERVGLAEVNLESGEPDIESVLASFPEGTYTVLGRTVGGTWLFSTASLSHLLLPAPDFSPRDGEPVNIDAVAITWDVVPDAEGYVVEVEQDDLGFNVTAELTADNLSFEVPATLLVPGVEYEVSIGTVSLDGNISIAESSFLVVQD